MPPKTKKDASLIRLLYASEDKAKQDGIVLAQRMSANQERNFKGLAVVNNFMLGKINDLGGIQAKILGTPIDTSGQYTDNSVKVYQCDDGQPYHADLIFEKPVPDGEPATEHRKYNEELIKMILEKEVYFEDKCPHLKRWCGALISKSIKLIFS